MGRDSEGAAAMWRAALSLDPSHLAALRGASRLFAHLALSSSSSASADGAEGGDRPVQDAALIGQAEALYQVLILV